MENYVAAQLQQLGAAVALGAAGGLLYDVLRAARLLDRRDRLLTHLLDALFVALLGAGVLWLALVVGEGELRLYMVTGMALGAVLWFCIPSRLLRPVWDFWAAALVAVCRLVGLPFVFLWRAAKKLLEIVKKGFSFLRGCATIRVEAWRKRHDNARRQQEGGSTVADGKKTKRTKKRPPAAVLLVLLALVAVLGIQIVKVYGQLKTAQREESVLNQQLAQQQQENDALRSDLSKKDDESFIKALARDLLGLAEEGERIFYDVNN